MSKKTVATGAAYVYLELLTSMFAGYFYWVIITRITTPDVIGLSSAVITIAGIFSTIAILGSPSGVQRFLGKSILSNDLETANFFVKLSLLIASIGSIICIVLLLIIYPWLNIYGFNYILLLLTILLFTSTAIGTLLRSVVVATLQTKSLPLVMILSTIAKICLTVVLVLYADKTLGIVIGYTSFPLIAACVLAIYVLRFFKKKQAEHSEHTEHSHNSFGKNFLELFKASLASWIPAVVYTIGVNFGVLFVFGAHGASLAGVYFIAFALVTAISAAMSALFSIAYPILSGMQDGRKSFSWRVIKISLLLSLPLSTSLMFFPGEVMSIFGPQYKSGALPLDILLLSILPLAIITGVNTLSYAYGNYKQVLIIGLATNLPRAILYPLLVPFYDSTGAAISFTAGSLAGLLISIFIARHIHLNLIWRDILLIFLIPVAFTFLISFSKLNFVIIISVSLILSYLVILKMRIIAQSDIEDAMTVLPTGISSSLVTFWSFVKKISR